MRIKDYTISFAKKLRKTEKEELISLEKELEYLHVQLCTGNSEIEERMICVQRKVDMYYKKQCDGAKVRSRVTHFEESESNTSYFLNLEHRNSTKKSISGIRIGKKVITDRNKIIKSVERFYSSLYTTQNPDMLLIEAYLKEINHPNLSGSEADECEGLISIKDATNAIKGMSLNKTPGIDGLTVEIFREFGVDIQDLVLDSLNEGYSKGKLSFLQRKGVVTLLFKSGDSMELGNWRPITLLNTDYKILATVLSNRLQKILTHLINEDQVGYIKGRSGICNARIIQDVIDYSMFNKTDGAIIFADFQKAFDTLEWKFIDVCLKIYGFKDSFRKWISVIYNDPHLNILTNGWLTRDINPSRGIRQGCPLSALIFILCIETLANQIRQNDNIVGLSIGYKHDNVKTFKILQLADDMTLFVRTVISGNTAINIIQNFETYSGIHLNKNKTKSLWLGISNPTNNIGNILWEDVYVKSLGIYFCKKKHISLELNWSEQRILKIKQLLQIWKQRNLTLRGKILILKSLIMSKIIYTTQVLSCPKEIVKELDKLFFDFLWKGRPAKVKRSNVVNTTEEGGLNMLDVETKVASLNLFWLCKYLSDELNPGCKCMFDYWFQQLGGINVIMNCKYNIKNKCFFFNRIPFFKF